MRLLLPPRQLLYEVGHILHGPLRHRVALDRPDEAKPRAMMSAPAAVMTAPAAVMSAPMDALMTAPAAVMTAPAAVTTVA